MIRNMLGWFCLFLINCLLQNGNAGVVTFIKPCKADDKKCLIESTQLAIPHFTKGIPELGVPVIDPLFVESGSFDAPNFQLKYKNLRIYGDSKSKIIDVTREKDHINLHIQFPLRAVGEFEANGRILFLDITQKGRFDISADDAEYTLKLNIKTVKGDDGKNYWKITGFDFTYDLVEHPVFKFDFDKTDDETSKLLHQALNENSKELTYMGTPVIKDMLALIVGHINKVLRVVPIEELEIT